MFPKKKKRSSLELKLSLVAYLEIFMHGLFHKNFILYRNKKTTQATILNDKILK